MIFSHVDFGKNLIFEENLVQEFCNYFREPIKAG